LRTGRPKKPDTLKKITTIHIRMTAEEYSLLKKLCKDLQMSKTAVILKGIRELSAKE
jgi:hypothetical protein